MAASGTNGGRRWSMTSDSLLGNGGSHSGAIETVGGWHCVPREQTRNRGGRRRRRRRKEEEGEAVHRDEHGSASAKFIIEFLLSIHLPLPNILT